MPKILSGEWEMTLKLNEKWEKKFKWELEKGTKFSGVVNQIKWTNPIFLEKNHIFTCFACIIRWNLCHLFIFISHKWIEKNIPNIMQLRGPSKIKWAVDTKENIKWAVETVPAHQDPLILFTCLEL